MRSSNKLIALIACAVPLTLLHGCGGGGRSDSAPAPLPAFSRDEYRPNYGHDLSRANYWPAQSVTYSFPAPGTATDIRLRPMATVAMSDRERQDARDGFAKWETALKGRLHFVEVQGPSNIEVSAQSQRDFGTDLYGLCVWHRLDADLGTLGRAVITFRADLSERRTRHVLLHEIGHALGLDGHDRKTGSVMNAVSPYLIGLVELAERDVNTVRAAYERD